MTALVLMILTPQLQSSSKIECPKWVQDAGKCGAFITVIRGAESWTAVLRAPPGISGVEVDDETVIITERRASLLHRTVLIVPGVESASLEEGRVRIVFKKPREPTLWERVRWPLLAFILGVLLGGAGK